MPHEVFVALILVAALSHPSCLIDAVQRSTRSHVTQSHVRHISRFVSKIMGSALAVVSPASQAGSDASRRRTRLATAVLVHELAQPLGAMTSNLDALRALPVTHASADVHAIVEDLASDVARAADILRSMHALVRSQRRRRISIPLAALVANALRYGHRPDGEGTSGAPLVEVKPLPNVRVVGDPAQLTQALTNVIRNAFQAVTPAGSAGCVEIGARCRGHDVWLEVRDTGPGFAAERLHAPLSPFVTTGRDGLGIGLVVARWVAMTHGGALQLENWAMGARVTLRLPIQSSRPPRH
jgi:C4-dicarboxylate-specific signal transduction histidine kinase